MKKLIIMFALVIGAVTVKAQSNDLFQGITQKFPYGQMVTPYGVQVTFAKTVHIIFPSTVKYVDLVLTILSQEKRMGQKMLSVLKLLPKVFREKPTFQLSVRTAVFILSMPNTPMSRKC